MQSDENNPPTKDSKKRRGRPNKSGFVREYPGQDYKLVTHTGPQKPPEDVPAPRVEPTDAHAKYPPPKSDPIFVKVWSEYIENITKRENFKTGHLNSLEMLCDLYSEYDSLKRFLEKKGRSYKSTGRNGVTWKFYPEVAQMNKVQAQIKEYTKMLGLLLQKDNSNESGAEKSNWE